MNLRVREQSLTVQSYRSHSSGLSKQCHHSLVRKKTEYIEGASQGDAFNTVTKELWDGEKGLTVIPCFQTTKYLEFVPRESGGGFQGEIHADDPDIFKTSRNGAKEILPNGNEMVKSDQHFCLVIR